MNTITLDDVLTRHEQDVLEHLDRQVTVPIVDFGRQGDVLVTPDRLQAVDFEAHTPIPKAGVPVVRGENGGNTHLLVADGPAAFDLAPERIDGLTLGVLNVPDGSIGYLIHPEHGAIGFAPGNYTISRQREQADEIRLVQD